MASGESLPGRVLLMRIRKRASGFWWIEACGWKLSIKLTRARWGYHRIGPGAFMWGLPFATGNVIPFRSR
jgi:hypothetical protein